LGRGLPTAVLTALVASADSSNAWASPAPAHAHARQRTNTCGRGAARCHCANCETASSTAGTPAPIIEKLNTAINQTLKHPDVLARFKSLGADIVGGPPSVLDTYFRSEVNKWTRLAEQVKFEAAD
jgi:hypothetical protein